MAVECCTPKTVHVILAVRGGKKVGKRVSRGGGREVSRETETERDTTWRERKQKERN